MNVANESGHKSPTPCRGCSGSPHSVRLSGIIIANWGRNYPPSPVGTAACRVRKTPGKYPDNQYVYTDGRNRTRHGAVPTSKSGYALVTLVILVILVILVTLVTVTRATRLTRVTRVTRVTRLNIFLNRKRRKAHKGQFCVVTLYHRHTGSHITNSSGVTDSHLRIYIIYIGESWKRERVFNNLA